MRESVENIALTVGGGVVAPGIGAAELVLGILVGLAFAMECDPRRRVPAPASRSTTTYGTPALGLRAAEKALAASRRGWRTTRAYDATDRKRPTSFRTYL